MPLWHQVVWHYRYRNGLLQLELNGQNFFGDVRSHPVQHSFQQTNKDLYLHGLEIRLPKPFETWNNMKRLIDRIVIRQFPDLNEDLILVTNRTHFSDSLKAHLNDLHVKAVFDNMPGKLAQSRFLLEIT